MTRGTKIIGLACIILLGMLVFIFKDSFLVSPNRVIMKVGEEQLFQKDLDKELSYFPVEERTQERRKIILGKMVTDSIILQAGQKEGIAVALDPTIFNSKNKVYLERIQAVERVKNAIFSRQDKLTGSVISIWFYNIRPGEIGYERGKQKASETIVKLHQAVLDGTLTMTQAANEIKKDESLAQVDPAYQANAIFDFSLDPKAPIVFDPEFTTRIQNLEEGQVSDIYLAKDQERNNKGVITGKKIDAVYMFAQLKEKKVTGKNPTIDDWIALKKKDYAITYY